MLPVADAHVGCKAERVGASGVAGCGFMVLEAGPEVQSPSFTITVCGPGAKLLKVVPGTYGSPSTLYVYPAPTGAVTVMLPVAVMQSGCTSARVGAAGITGCGLMVFGVGAETQSPNFTVML